MKTVKPKVRKTVDGKKIINLTYCASIEVFIGIIQMSNNSNRAAMWTKEGVHIKRTTPNLNLSL
jgi:hypothetical protein